MDKASLSIEIPPLDGQLAADAWRTRDLLFGYVADPRDWARRFAVELYVDGYPHRLTRADRDVKMPDLGQPFNDFGFVFDLRELTSWTWEVVDLRLANTARILARFGHADLVSKFEPDAPGRFKWVGGLRFEAMLPGQDLTTSALKIIVDEVLVCELTDAKLMFDDLDPARRRAAPTFDVHLPAHYADGRVHLAHAVDGFGQTLVGSPVAFLAFEDGLRELLERRAEVPGERLRADEFERLFPQSLPFSAFSAWRGRVPTAAPPEMDTAAALLVIGEPTEGASEPALGPFSEAIVGVIPADGHQRFDPHEVEAFVRTEAAGAEFVVLALAGEILEPDALPRLTAPLVAAPAARLAYGDRLDHGDIGGDLPLFLPDFDAERFLEQGYASACFAVRRNALLAALERGVDSLPALFLAVSAGGDASMVVHVPQVVSRRAANAPRLQLATLERAVAAHLHEQRVMADLRPKPDTAFPTLHVQRRVVAEDVAVIIAADSDAAKLSACIHHLRGATSRHRLHLIFAHLNAGDPSLIRYLGHPDLRSARVIQLGEAGAPAEAYNRAARTTGAPYLLFLDPAVRIMEGDLLDELIGRCAGPRIAAAAPAIAWPEGTLQSLGLVVDFATGARPVGRGAGPEDAGYGGLLRAARECSALSASCLLVRAADHQAIGGFDSGAFPRIFFDLDYGLRLRHGGRRLVATPHARVLSEPDLTRRRPPTASGEAAFTRELANLRLRWGEALLHDPFYHPALARVGDPFSALAWPARPLVTSGAGEAHDG